MLTNLIEIYSMMLLPGACVIAFGKMAGESHRRRMAEEAPRNALPSHKTGLTARCFGVEGRSVFLAMSMLFLLGLGLCVWAERQGNPALTALGLEQSMGSMEGKETRFGVPLSALFTTVTTSFTTGTVNNMHDTLTPLGGLVPLLHMMLNVVFGGKGVGLMNMLLYAILAVFLCGLMVGRTPEYLGRKIEGREMKLTALCIIIQLAIVGSLMKKNDVGESAGTLKTGTVSFAVILGFVVYIFAALTFFPALALGPIAEHLTLWG